MPRLRDPSTYETETLRRRAWVDWTLGEPEPLLDMFTIASATATYCARIRWSELANLAFEHDVNISIEEYHQFCETMPFPLISRYTLKILNMLQNIAKDCPGWEVSFEAVVREVERVPSFKRSHIALRELMATGLVKYIDECDPVTEYAEIVRVTEKGMQAIYPSLPELKPPSVEFNYPPFP